MNQETKGIHNSIFLRDLQNAFLKVCKIHNMYLVMIYDEKTNTVTFRTESK